jgi:hypothetical protein
MASVAKPSPAPDVLTYYQLQNANQGAIKRIFTYLENFHIPCLVRQLFHELPQLFGELGDTKCVLVYVVQCFWLEEWHLSAYKWDKVIAHRP